MGNSECAAQQWSPMPTNDTVAMIRKEGHKQAAGEPVDLLHDSGLREDMHGFGDFGAAIANAASEMTLVVITRPQMAAIAQRYLDCCWLAAAWERVPRPCSGTATGDMKSSSTL